MSGQSDRTVACSALLRYDVAPRRVRLAARSFNSTYRVTTAAAVYALRVGSALRIHPEGTEAVEAAWHRRLREQGVQVPGVLANVAGEVTTLVPDHDTVRACVLFDWVAGRLLRTCLTGRPWPDVSPDLFEWPSGSSSIMNHQSHQVRTNASFSRSRCSMTAGRP